VSRYQRAGVRLPRSGGQAVHPPGGPGPSGTDCRRKHDSLRPDT